jgi:hypothetical protein
MSFYRLEPEVAGGWGTNTVFTRIPGKPVVVHKLHYHFDGWLGDELLASSLCYIVTQRLADEIQDAQLTGVGVADVEVTTSEQFRELYPERELPRFLWLKVVGKVGKDDFGLDEQHRLVVSERALQVLKGTSLDNCDVSDYSV